MDTVSRRAKNYKQPRGGFVPPSTMNVEKLDDGIDLYDDENISPSIVGTVVDYMSRYLDNYSLEESFFIPINGAKRIDMEEKAKNLLKNIDGLNDKSIVSACKLVGFDSVYRAGPMTYKPIEDINPNQHTIFNIITMIKRTMNFFENNGPIIDEGMTFIGGYTKTVISGDADLMTKDTIWDIKVSKNPLKPFHTLQILMYYLMGCKAIKLSAEYDFKNSIKKIGIYNPRLNIAYTKKVSDIDKSVLIDVEKNVLGYSENEKDPLLNLLLEKILKKNRGDKY